MVNFRVEATTKNNVAERVFAEYCIGLDSQTAWSICALLRKLADSGQAILCTIHQPSAILLQEFDRLLFLAMGGKTLYFGDIGDSAKTLTRYFERNGARPCGEDENPAEWILEITGAADGSGSTQDWPAIWNTSKEHEAVKAELARLKGRPSQQSLSVNDPDALQPFAAPFATQLWTVLVRVFQQYWRTPSYLYSKVALCLFSVSAASFRNSTECVLYQPRQCSSDSPSGKRPTRSRGYRTNCSPSSCS